MTDSYRPEETEAPVPSTSGISPGALIRGARERALMSQDELSAQLRLSRATLDALERDHFAALSEPVYIRGYYRKCAKFLNIAEAELLNAYDRMAVRKGAPMPTKLLLAGNDEGGRSRGGTKWLLWAAVVAAAVVIAGFAVRKHGAPEAQVGTVTSTPDTDAGTPIAAQPSPESSPASVSSAVTADAEQQRVAETAAAPSSAPAPVSAPAMPAMPSVPAAVRTEAPRPVKQHQPLVQPHVDHDQMAVAAPPKPVAQASVPGPAESVSETRVPLQVHIHATSWVHIEDANGKLLISRMMHPGDSERVQGPAPYLVFVGYAPGVDLQYGDMIIDLQPYSRDNSTARLKVPTETPQ